MKLTEIAFFKNAIINSKYPSFIYGPFWNILFCYFPWFYLNFIIAKVYKNSQTTYLIPRKSLDERKGQ